MASTLEEYLDAIDAFEVDGDFDHLLETVGPLPKVDPRSAQDLAIAKGEPLAFGDDMMTDWQIIAAAAVVIMDPTAARRFLNAIRAE